MKRNKGFTLIELMIVVAIIAIIAAIAIPNLLQSRIQANEANAVAALKTYATGQSTWQKARYAEAPSTTDAGQYADFFEALNEKGLVPDTMAAAVDTTVGFQGYCFDEGADKAAVNWGFSFQLYATPCVYEQSGINSYYIDGSGTIKYQDLGATTEPSAATGGSTDAAWANY